MSFLITLPFLIQMFRGNTAMPRGDSRIGGGTTEQESGMGVGNSLAGYASILDDYHQSARGKLAGRLSPLTLAAKARAYQRS